MRGGARDDLDLPRRGGRGGLDLDRPPRGGNPRFRGRGGEFRDDNFPQRGGFRGGRQEGGFREDRRPPFRGDYNDRDSRP